MALLWAGGAELQSTAANVEFTAFLTTAPAIETTTKRSGAAAWRISNITAVEGFRQAHSSAQGLFYFQFYLYIVAMPTLTSVIGGARVTGSNKVSIRLTAAGLLQLYNSEDSAQVGTDSSALSTATWYRVAMSYDTTTLATTAVEARAYADTPGASAFWNPSGTVDMAATLTAYAINGGGGDATLDYIVDDCTINDTTGSFWNTWPPENKLIILRPNANGDNSAWTGSDGNSTDNYLLVDEVPPDSADYVQSNTSGQIDDYNLEATPAAIGSSDTIRAVLVGAYAAVDDATSADPNIVLRIKAAAAGTVEESATLDVNSLTYHGPAPLPATDNYQLVLYDLPGASTTAWTKADLDAAQAGVREDITDTHFARVGALWVYVSFTPSTGTLYNHAVAGTQTTAGALAKRTGKPLAGTVTSSGAMFKLAGKTLSGGLTSAGAMFKRTGKALAGTLTSSGFLTTIKHALVVVGGTLTSAGALTLRTGKALAGSIAPAGTLIRQTAKALAGVLSTAASVAADFISGSGNTFFEAVGGTLTSAGSLARQTGKAVGGTLTSAGALVRAISLHLAGTIGLAGSAGKGLAVALAGTLSFAGTLVASIVGPVLFYPPGTRDVRRARGRVELLSDAPGRQRSKGRGDLEAEG